MPGNTPDAQASFRYDGEGERVAQQSTISGGTTTTTRYLLGGLEELTTSGSTSTLTKYYSVPGVVTAIKVGTTLSYLATDGLGSVSVVLSAAGSTTGQALYSPYGAGRYSSGSLPTARGYTGQYQDTTSGLDYYGARYYDPALGQFTSADTVQAGGLNRYAYVHDTPTTATDPSGHQPAKADGGWWPWLLASADPLFLAGELLVVSGYLIYEYNTTPVPTNTQPQYPGAVPVAAPTPQPTYPGQGTATGPVGASGPFVHMGSNGWRPINNRPTPTGGGGGGGGGQGGGGSGPQQPATSSGSQESWAPDEPAPEPSTDGARRGSGRRCDDPAVILAGLCVFYHQKELTHGCAGRCVIRGSLTDTINVVGTGKNSNANHSEIQQAGIASNIISSLAQAGDSVRMDIISFYYPCSYGCRDDIPVLTSDLSDLASRLGLRFEIHWWYLNRFQGYWPYEY